MQLSWGRRWTEQPPGNSWRAQQREHRLFSVAIRQETAAHASVCRDSSAWLLAERDTCQDGRAVLLAACTFAGKGCSQPRVPGFTGVVRPFTGQMLWTIDSIGKALHRRMSTRIVTLHVLAPPDPWQPYVVSLPCHAKVNKGCDVSHSTMVIKNCKH